MESSIWEGSDSPNARNQYIKLASKYKRKNGSLFGFIKEHGLLKLNNNLHKVRVSGDRFKLANLWSYNKYQKLRSSREGYDQIRKDLEKLGVDKSEIDSFIAKDKKLYKQKVNQISSDETKGHVLALDKGGRDGSWNIEPEPPSKNYSKKAKSPSKAALLAEGVPRNTLEAFIRSKDPSGLPDPLDFSADERTQLRKLKTPAEVDDFLTSKYDPEFNARNTNKGMGLSRVQDVLASSTKRAGEKIARNLVPGVGTAMDIQDTKQRFDEFKADPNLMNAAQLGTQAISSGANVISDIALATGIGAPVAAVAEKVSGLTSLADAMLQGVEEYLQPPTTPQ